MTAANYIGMGMFASLLVAAFAFVWREEGLRSACKFFGLLIGIVAFMTTAMYLIGYQS